MVITSSRTSTTTEDLDMLDAAAAEQRPSLPTSLSDFALASSAPSSPSSGDDGLSPFFRRLRRSSLLAANPITADVDARPSSPLVTRLSFDSRMTDDSSPSSETTAVSASLLFQTRPTTSNASLTTPLRRVGSPALSVDTSEIAARRRISIPPKPTRLLDLRTELRSPIESELKSEAQFQRLIASYSYSGVPNSKLLPRTPRAWADRGRYPEEAGGSDDDSHSVESASDDGEENNPSAGASTSASVSASTPSGVGEEQAMTIDTSIVGPFMMDVDIPSVVSSPTQWRQTPPPTQSSVRHNKRKFDDRYDPYPLSAKRRAVSPSVHTHHSYHPHSHSHSHSNSHSNSHPHSHATHSHPHSHHNRTSACAHPASPISIPRPRSLTSSPVMHPTSSPIMRPTSFPGLSPVLKGSPTVRAIPRLTLKSGSDMRRGVDGAGEAVGSLSIA